MSDRYTDETRPRFVCSHSDRDDRRPTEIPFYLHGRGNGSVAYRGKVASRMQETLDSSELLRSIDDLDLDEATDLRSAFLAERERSAQFANVVDEHEANLSALNHHQIECPTCGFTERLRGQDVEALLAWSEEHGARDIPLRVTRRLLILLAEMSTEG